VGSHPEYATPECDDVLDLVAHDKAGARILEDLLADADRRLREEGIAGDIYVFKNNADPAGRPYVCQENYLVSRQGEFGLLADILIPFLVTRQVICGAGTVLHGPQGAVYCMSQRAGHIWESVSSDARRFGVIINGDEPQADAERFRRLHVTVGDSNMSETTTLLKVGATDLVLRMVEAGTVMGDLTLDNPLRAIRDVSHDITGRRRVRLASGREMSAVEIQYEYLSRATDFTERAGLDAISARVLQMWERALGAIDDGDLDKIAREIDWVIKYQLIERYRASHDLPLSSPRGRPARPGLPRRAPRPRPVLPAAALRRGGPGRAGPGHLRGQVHAAARSSTDMTTAVNWPLSGEAPRGGLTLAECVSAPPVMAEPGLILASPAPARPGPDGVGVGCAGLDQGDQQAADLR